MINSGQPNDLLHQLINSGINVSLWGIGKSKSVENLQKELDSGETVLSLDKNGGLLREVTGIGVDVFFSSKNSQKLILKEDRQIFPDGSIRYRHMNTSISEKMKINENPHTAALRGLKEELGIDSSVELLPNGIYKEEHTSSTYPGLNSHYTKYKFIANISPEQYRSSGYHEVDDGITTYFVWQKI